MTSGDGKDAKSDPPSASSSPAPASPADNARRRGGVLSAERAIRALRGANAEHRAATIAANSAPRNTAREVVAVSSSPDSGRANGQQSPF